MPEWGQEQKGAILSRWFTRSRSERLCINSNFRTRKLGVSSGNLCVLSQICGPDWICEIWNFQCGFSGTSGQGMGEFVKGKHPDIFFSWQDSNWYGIAVWRFTHIFGSAHPYDRDVYDTFVWGDLDYWIHTFRRPIILVISLSVIRRLKPRLPREKFASVAFNEFL